MLGSAMFTTVMSSTIMSCAHSMMARVMPGRWRAAAGPVRGGVVTADEGMSSFPREYVLRRTLGDPDGVASAGQMS